MQYASLTWGMNAPGTIRAVIERRESIMWSNIKRGGSRKRVKGE